VPDPSLRFGIRLRDALARLGIRVCGNVRVLGAGAGRRVPLTEIAFVESETMRVMVRDILKDSRNVTTDLLLRHAGATAQATNTVLAGLSSEEAGVKCLTNFCVTKAGIPSGMLRLESGTGLSLNNRASASAIVGLLSFMSSHLSGDAFSNALPVAGVDGTLKDRMTGTKAAGRVSAKTGTLRRGVSLSGYVASAAGESLAFAILLSDFEETPADPVYKDLDDIAVLLAALSERTSLQRTQ
jgi:D-alanyl-D-alanine carboxypeptidase/D-alanyl-D-alanine-endopeptidase (penicillin-binding protein 4)